MTTTAEPKWSIWLGDGWPGPYIVIYNLKNGRRKIIVVNGVLSCPEAMAIAAEEIDIPDEEIESAEITVGHVAEATHHMAALQAFRDEHKEIESGAAT